MALDRLSRQFSHKWTVINGLELMQLYIHPLFSQNTAGIRRYVRIQTQLVREIAQSPISVLTINFARHIRKAPKMPLLW